MQISYLKCDSMNNVEMFFYIVSYFAGITKKFLITDQSDIIELTVSLAWLLSI